MAERRKTGHLTKRFKEFARENLKQVLGVELNEDQAWEIFKLCHKIPMRFLVTEVGQEDLDRRGEKAVSLPGVGKFKFRMTVPQKKKKNLVGDDGLYPRYKFYPARSMEVEVENLHGIADVESKEAFEKAKKSEERHIEKTREELAKVYRKSLGEAVANGTKLDPKQVSFEEYIQSLIDKGIAKALKNEKAAASVNNVEEVDEEELEEDIPEEDEDDDEDEEETVEDVASAEETSKTDELVVNDFDFDFEG